MPKEFFLFYTDYFYKLHLMDPNMNIDLVRSTRLKYNARNETYHETCSTHRFNKHACMMYCSLISSGEAIVHVSGSCDPDNFV